jgi:cysteinyl-tRNA synthetase
MSEIHLRLHDTLTGKLTPFVPRHEGKAGVYTCGPTTYDVAHVGHARASLAPDVLVRYLRAKGLEVTYVRNITDVDDRILQRAERNGTTPLELSASMAKLYQEDMRAVGCADPDVEPRVSGNIAEIIALVEKLIAVGAAYAVDMGTGARDVYYKVRAFPGYGKLSKRNVDDLRVGARVEASEDKEDPLDFALWKGCVGDAWGWESPWGKGRPGWHIECSAMSERYLGHGFDVHCGGMDLIFPHHENEIAQSEAAHPGCGNFVGIWIHNGFVNVDKEKMSKSLGNFVTVRDVLARNDAEALRYFLLAVHYRGPIGFDVESRCVPCGGLRQEALPEGKVRVLEAAEPCPACGKPGPGRVIFPGILEAERRIDHLYQALARVTITQDATDATVSARVPSDLLPFSRLAAEARDRVFAALDDDLNTPAALAVLTELAKAANELADLAHKRRKDTDLQRALPYVAVKLQAALLAALKPLGLLQTPADEYRARTQAQRLAILGTTPEQIDARLAERAAARQAKDFARADVLRKELDAQGIEVADGAEGTTWRVAPGGRVPERAAP